MLNYGCGIGSVIKEEEMVKLGKKELNGSFGVEDFLNVVFKMKHGPSGLGFIFFFFFFFF